MQLRFRLGQIPVTIHGSFLFMTVILGAVGDRDPATVAIWVAVVAFSVLIHELGHALMGRAFGLTPAIDLHGMGGTTSWPQGKDISHGKRILISLAGPGVGIFLAVALIVAMAFGLKPASRLGLTTFQDLLWVNGGWAVLNLIPMLPLDGGNVMTHVLNILTGGRGERPARIVSLVVAILVGVGALAIGWIWSTILAASFAIQNARMLGSASRSEKDEPLRTALEKAVFELHSGNARAAIESAEAVAHEAQNPELRIEALRIVAYALVADGRWSQLMQLLEGGLARAIGEDDLARFEQAARESGSREAADAILALREGRAQPASDFHAG